MVAERSGKGRAVQLEVLKGARHAFDSPLQKVGIEHYGYRMGLRPKNWKVRFGSF
ncbi:hypothetical protein GCM10007881_04060 [Mesorhizobium huakuii]|nr:hypothetical protein GCM10007881_04060 [Mesorhizobium huakuii]